MTTDTSTRFVHLSDAHIGHRQYGLKKRRDDMYMTFRTTILDAIDENVDFAVFSGDLFHNKNVNARALSDAETCLTEFSQASIPVAAIQGNHDANLYMEDLNWLEYLHSREHLILLEADFQGDGPIFEEHSFEEPGTSSGYVDFGDVRVFGLQYLGQRTADRLSDVAEAIEQVNDEKGDPAVTVLLGHFGIEGHIPGMSGGISYNALNPLEQVVDYLGLGHLHKQYSHGDWVFNPGSLESHNTRQARWDLGYYIADVSDDGVSTTYHLAKRRPFHRMDFPVDGYDTPSGLIQGFKEEVANELKALRQTLEQPHHMTEGETRSPVIDLRLQGLLQFNRTELDIDEIERIVTEEMDALYVNLSDATESVETASIVQDLEGGEDAVRDEEGQLDHDKLETAVFKKLVGQDARYDSREAEVAETLGAVKRSVVNEDPPETIADMIKEQRRALFPSQGGDD